MWRRYGDDVYAVVVLVVFAIEAIVLAVLTGGFILRLAGVVESARISGLAIWALIVTAVSLAIVTACVLGYHAITERRDKLDAEQLKTWTERWNRALLQGHRLPRFLIRREALESLLNLREVLSGEEGEKLAQLVRRYRIGPRLLRHLAPGHIAVRLDALEALSRARVPEALPSLIELLEDHEPRVRLVAARAAARTLGAMPAGEQRRDAAARFAAKLAAGTLPSGVLEQGLVLLEGAAGDVIERILEDPRLEGSSVLHAGLETIARLGLRSFAPRLGPIARHPDPEIRAAAIRALGALRTLPDECREPLRAACGSETEFVRVQGARAAWLLGPDEAVSILWAHLGDDSWWVRRAAGQALLDLGAEGESALERASERHPDRYAREMAAQTLRDARAMRRGADALRAAM